MITFNNINSERKQLFIGIAIPVLLNVLLFSLSSISHMYIDKLLDHERASLAGLILYLENGIGLIINAAVLVHFYVKSKSIFRGMIIGYLLLIASFPLILCIATSLSYYY